VERLIRASAGFGLVSLILGGYALVYRAASACRVPEGCDIPIAANHHPHADLGIGLVAVGCVAFCLAVILRHRTARENFAAP
jgi:hypothetical protein